jgi:integrase
VLSPDQFAELLTHVPDQEFRDYLLFLWNTGCRAMEIRLIEKRHYDGTTITLAASEAKGKKKPRVIYLNDPAREIIERLCKIHPTGALFRTVEGKQWTANSVRCRFTRTNKPGKTKRGKERKPQGLAAKMGLPGLCATTIRHSWATNAIKAGLDTTTASLLMGHADPATCARNYQHLSSDKSYLQNAIKALPISVPVLPGIAPVVHA